MSITQDGRIMQIATPLGKDFLLINKFSASEGLSELFRFDVELLHDEESDGDTPTLVDVKNILGQRVGITVTQANQLKRHFNGIVSAFSQGNRNGRFSYY